MRGEGHVVGHWQAAQVASLALARNGTRAAEARGPADSHRLVAGQGKMEG